MSQLSRTCAITGFFCFCFPVTQPWPMNDDRFQQRRGACCRLKLVTTPVLPSRGPLVGGRQPEPTGNLQPPGADPRPRQRDIRPLYRAAGGRAYAADSPTGGTTTGGRRSGVRTCTSRRRSRDWGLIGCRRNDACAAVPPCSTVPFRLPSEDRF